MLFLSILVFQLNNILTSPILTPPLENAEDVPTIQSYNFGRFCLLPPDLGIQVYNLFR